jgi:hypothetical protein
MRLREFHLIEDHRSTLGIHPHLTVVAGLSPTARDWMVYAVGALLRGEDCGLAARVEHDGAVAEIGASGGLDPFLPAGVEVVVRSPALAGLVAAASSVDAPAADTELGRAVAAHQAAAASAAAVREAVERCRVAYGAAVEAVGQVQLAIDQAHGDLDRYASTEREALVRQAMRIEDELGLPRGACRADTLDSAKDRVVLVEDQLRDLVETLDLLEPEGAARVADALDVVRRVTASGPVPSSEAAFLADEWHCVSEHLAAIEARFASAYGGIPAMTERLEAARSRVARCEASALPEPTDPAVIAALEAAHDRVLEAERKASGRLGGARTRRALDAALAEEQEILDRLGYRTWSAWIMGESMQNSSAERALAVESARAELVDANHEWEALRSDLARDAAFTALLDRLEGLVPAIQALVGEVDDPEAALRAVRVEPGPPAVGVAEARAGLLAALVAAGFDLDASAPLEDLRLVAERWLAEVGAVTALSRQLGFDRESAQAELAEAKDAFLRIETLGEAVDARAADQAELLQVREAITAVEQRVHRHRRALSRLVQLAAERAEIHERARQLRQETEAKEELLEVVETGAGAALGRLRAVEARTGRVGDAPAAIVHELGRLIDETATLAGSPVPVVFEDVLAGVPRPLLDAGLAFLESRAAQQQIIYVSDQPDVLAWAAARAPERVAVARGTGFFG